MKATRVFLYFTILCLISFSTHASYYFYDGFETGDFSKSENGFRWTSAPNCSVVTKDAETYQNLGWTLEHEGLEAANGRDWIPKVGTHSHRITYAANGGWAEHRFDLGTPLPEVWVKYWLRVPTNYRHWPNGGSGINNKFFYLWQGAFHDKWDYRWQTDAAGGGSYLEMSYNDPGQKGGVTLKEFSKKFIATPPTDNGRWMQVVHHLKIETSAGASDGVQETYRRWDGEPSFTLFNGWSNLPISRRPGVEGITGGYLMGHANSTYQEETDWLIDEFEISSESLLEVDRVAPPEPPSFIR